jgi:hypothetical protein
MVMRYTRESGSEIRDSVDGEALKAKKFEDRSSEIRDRKSEDRCRSRKGGMLKAAQWNIQKIPQANDS